mgnify:CR=1 FL=1
MTGISYRNILFYMIINFSKIPVEFQQGKWQACLQENTLILHCFYQGIARTQSPTNKNYAPELPTFGAIARVSPTGVQWKGLALGEPPCRSRYPLCQVSMLSQSPCLVFEPTEALEFKLHSMYSTCLYFQ